MTVGEGPCCRESGALLRVAEGGTDHFHKRRTW